jgi:hypothetical protein
MDIDNNDYDYSFLCANQDLFSTAAGAADGCRTRHAGSIRRSWRAVRRINIRYMM